jgi:hypothetical protein
MASRIRNELVGMIDRALGADPKAALIASRQLKEEIEWLTERSVALARREGYEWAPISRLLGISRQWARERFKAAPPRQPPHVVAMNRYLREQRETERLVRQFKSRSTELHRGQDDLDEEPVAW